MSIRVSGQAYAAIAASEAAAAAAQAAATAAATSASEASSVVATGLPSDFYAFQNIGLPLGVTPVTGTAASNNVFVFHDPVTVAGTITEIRLFGMNGGGTLKVKRATRSGTTETINHEYSIPFGAGVQTLEAGTDFAAIPVVVGDQLGFYAFSTNGKVSFVAATGDSGGYYNNSGTGDVTVGNSFDDGAVVTANRFQIGFTIAGPYPTTSRVQGMEASIASNATTATTAAATASAANTLATSANTSVVQLDATGQQKSTYAQVHTNWIGRSSPITGTAGGNTTYVYYPIILARSLLKKVSIYAAAAGTIQVRRFTRDFTTGVITPLGSTLTLTIPGAGQKIFDADAGDFVPMTVNAGELIGFYAGTNYFFVTDDQNTSFYFSASGNQIDVGFTDLVASAQSIQVGFGFEIAEIAKSHGARVMPGESLGVHDRWLLSTTSWVVYISSGQSLSTGAFGNEFDYTTIYSNKKFIQSLRAAKSGTLTPAVSQNGGTASIDAAAENNVNNTGIDFSEENTGHVRAVDHLCFLANRDLGVLPANNVHLAVCVGHATYSIIQLMPSRFGAWFNVLVEALSEALARITAAGGASARVPIVSFRLGHTDANQNTMGYAAFKANVLSYMRDANSLIKGTFGQTEQTHWLVQQPSTFAETTDGDYTQALLDLADEHSWIHCVGGDYPYPKQSGTGAHLNAYGYTMAGLIDATAGHEIVRLAKKPRAIKPLGAWRSGATVTQRFWSIDPLAYHVTGWTSTSQGFAVKDMVSGSLLTLTGDGTINNSPTGALSPYHRDMTFTLSADPGHDVQVRYGIDYDVSHRSTGTSGGNLRTTWTETYTINSVATPIYHFCPHFKRNALSV